MNVWSDAGTEYLESGVPAPKPVTNTLTSLSLSSTTGPREPIFFGNDILMKKIRMTVVLDYPAVLEYLEASSMQLTQRRHS